MSKMGRKFLDEQEQAEMSLCFLGLTDPQEGHELIERYGPREAVIQYVKSLPDPKP